MTRMSTPDDTAGNFRDSVATIGTKGRRVWIYPTKPKGRYHTARSILAVFLLTVLFAGPFMKIGGRPILLLNIIERKFFIFGLTFWPQDFHIFVLLAIALVVFILLFTAVLGRLFCGWICPQTVFMEMVFRKIEYLIEGNASRQRKLDQEGTTAEKFFKKTAKHAIFFALSFLIGNTFLAYFIGIDALKKIVTLPPSEHAVGFIAMTIFSLVFYGVFSRFREQACTMVCPYGRLQSVLLDTNSLIVAYDYNRGEPRCKYIDDKERLNSGHCIECGACVRVCPTGIDIRDGIQLECVHCTACIDACGRVMKGLKLPTGLIRYTSQNMLEAGKRFALTARIIVYGILFIFLFTLITFLIAGRNDVETTILRTPGTLYEQTDDGIIRNLYNFKVVNKTFENIDIELKLRTPAGEIEMVGGSIEVSPDDLAEGVFFAVIPVDKLYSGNTLIQIDVIADGKVVEEIKTSFMGPDLRRKN